jgi:hypothetical protein
MAKGLRASSERSNRRKLRANVFGPAEKARAERLHAKLLATIQSEKPAPPEKKAMDVDEEGTHSPWNTSDSHANAHAASTEAAAKDDLSKGSFVFTAPVPSSLSHTSTSAASDPDSASDSDPSLRNFCFYLGLSSDILGFTSSGDVALAFASIPPLS